MAHFASIKCMSDAALDLGWEKRDERWAAQLLECCDSHKERPVNSDILR